MLYKINGLIFPIRVMFIGMCMYMYHGTTRFCTECVNFAMPIQYSVFRILYKAGRNNYWRNPVGVKLYPWCAVGHSLHVAQGSKGLPRGACPPLNETLLYSKSHQHDVIIIFTELWEHKVSITGLIVDWWFISHVNKSIENLTSVS